MLSIRFGTAAAAFLTGVCLASLGTAQTAPTEHTPSGAQIAPSSPFTRPVDVWARSAEPTRTTAGDLRVTPALRAANPPPAYHWDMHEMSRYAGWGGAVGATAGFAWGEARASRHQTGPVRTRPLEIAGDAVLGFCAGMVGGGVVYVIHLARQP